MSLCVLLALSAPRVAAPPEEGPPGTLRARLSPTSAATAVLDFSSPTGFGDGAYRLHRSRDLRTWTPFRSGLAPAGETVLVLPTDDATHAFFRLELAPLRPLASMVWIAPGEFVMGSPPEEEGRFLDKEEPQTRVALTRGY